MTGEMVEELLLAGADIIKVGIGPGSVCTTRKKTGVGYPQLSAIIECVDAAHGLGGHIISDGGCVCPGDVSKAFGAGADFVMIGGMFAGHDESGGDLIELPNGEKKKQFYGMASATAMKKYAGGVAEYRYDAQLTFSVQSSSHVLYFVLNFFQSLGRQVRRDRISGSSRWDGSGHLGWGAVDVYVRWCAHTQAASQTNHLHSCDTTNQRGLFFVQQKRLKIVSLGPKL